MYCTWIVFYPNLWNLSSDSPPGGDNQQGANEQRGTMLIYVSANTASPFGVPVLEPPATPAHALSQEKGQQGFVCSGHSRDFQVMRLLHLFCLVGWFLWPRGSSYLITIFSRMFCWDI